MFDKSIAKLNFTKSIFTFSLALLIFIGQNSIVEVTKVQASTKKQISYNPIEKIYSNSSESNASANIELFVDGNDLNLNLDEDSRSSNQVDFRLDASSLLVKSS